MSMSRRVSLWSNGLFWVGAVASVVGCGSDDAPAVVPAAVAGAAATSTDAGVDAGAPAVVGATPEGGGPLSSGADAGLDTPPVSGLCAPGETRECSFDLICNGVQTCDENAVFGPCNCGDLPLEGTSIVGARCATDADCLGGATCLRADNDSYLGAGGPPGGYCSFACSLEADDCTTHDPQTFCAPLGPDGAGYCIRTCLSQDPDDGEAKCLNRADVVCVSAAADGALPFNGTRQPGYCRPFCGSDEDCPAGRVCHRQGHICTDTQFPGAPVGAACSLDADCSGNECEDQNDENIGVCTSTCVLGSLSGCGFGHEAGAGRGAACLTPLVALAGFSEGVGDLGLCRELCDVAEECEQAASAGWICTPLSPEAAEFFGKTGACVPPRPDPEP